MKMIAAAFLLTVLTGASFAAAAPEAPPIFGKIKPKVGSWAQYSMEAVKGEKTHSKGLIRMAVVGKEGDSLWIEQKFAMEIPKPRKGAEEIATKMLMGQDGVEKMYMKSSHGVLDMTSMMGAAARKKHAANQRAKMTEVGPETITVAAGTFKTTHYTFDDGKTSGDTWINKEAGPYGMIRQVHHNGKIVSTMELVDSGNDAKSEVDETTAKTMTQEILGRSSRPKTPAASDDATAAEAPASDAGAPTADAAPAPAAAPAEDPAPADKPTVGGFFKSVLKKKIGLGGN